MEMLVPRITTLSERGFNEVFLSSVLLGVQLNNLCLCACQRNVQIFLYDEQTSKIFGYVEDVALIF